MTNPLSQYRQWIRSICCCSFCGARVQAGWSATPKLISGEIHQIWSLTSETAGIAIQPIGQLVRLEL
jgi:hypothetical protein